MGKGKLDNREKYIINEIIKDFTEQKKRPNGINLENEHKSTTKHIKFHKPRLKNNTPKLFQRERTASLQKKKNHMNIRLLLDHNAYLKTIKQKKWQISNKKTPF